MVKSSYSEDLSKKSITWTVCSIGIAFLIASAFLFIQLIASEPVKYLASWFVAIALLILGIKISNVAIKILHQTARSKR